MMQVMRCDDSELCSKLIDDVADKIPIGQLEMYQIDTISRGIRVLFGCSIYVILGPKG